jgi:uncharacterized membrane protein HdeD (DUF308 family)
MSNHDTGKQRTWWKLVLTGFLAIVFGLCAVALPGGIIFGRIVDVILGSAKPFSGSMTAVAALLALVALVAVDGLVNLLKTDAEDKRSNTFRGVMGVAVAIAAIVWPGKTAYFAVELIGLWAIVVGVLELSVARYSHESAKYRALLILAAITSILVGVGVMIWALLGAVVISALVGIAAIARGTSLIMSEICERNQLDNEQAAAA